jgi:hypothetical protein
MLTIILIILIVLLVFGWGGNRYSGWYGGGAPDLIWVVVVFLVIFLVLRLLGII